MSIVDTIMKQQRIISEQIHKDELLVLLKELEKVLSNGTAGDVVEMGCYEGTSALFLQRMLVELAPEKTLYLYDSFEGLPDKTQHDQDESGNLFQKGALRASRGELLRNFTKARLPHPEVVRGWFYELDTQDMPPDICFAFLDGDFYESIMDSFKIIWPNLSLGAVVAVDDYVHIGLPGVRKAVDEWAALHNLQIRSEASLALLTKKR